MEPLAVSIPNETHTIISLKSSMNRTITLTEDIKARTMLFFLSLVFPFSVIGLFSCSKGAKRNIIIIEKTTAAKDTMGYSSICTNLINTIKIPSTAAKMEQQPRCVLA